MLSKVTQNLIQPINDSVVELTVVASNAQVHKTPIPNLTAVSTPVADNIKNLVVAAKKTLEHSIIQSKSFLHGSLETEHESKINALLPKIDAIGTSANQAGLSLIKNCDELAKNPIHPDYLNGLVECLKIILCSTQDLLNIWDESEVLRILYVSKSLRESISALKSSDFNIFIKQPPLLLQATKPVYQLAVMLLQLVKNRANDLLNPQVSQFLDSKSFLLNQSSPLLIAIAKAMFEHVQVIAAMATNQQTLNVNLSSQLSQCCDIALNHCLDIEHSLINSDLQQSLLPQIIDKLPTIKFNDVKSELTKCITQITTTSNHLINNANQLQININAVIDQSLLYSQYYIPSGKQLIQNYCLALKEEASSLNHESSSGNTLQSTISSILAINSGLSKLQQTHFMYIQSSLKQRLENKDPLLLVLLSHLLAQHPFNQDMIDYLIKCQALYQYYDMKTTSLIMIQSYREALGDEFANNSQLNLYGKALVTHFNDVCSSLYTSLFIKRQGNLIDSTSLIHANLQAIYECVPPPVNTIKKDHLQNKVKQLILHLQKDKHPKSFPFLQQLNTLQDSNQLLTVIDEIYTNGLAPGCIHLMTALDAILKDPSLLQHPYMQSNLRDAMAEDTTNKALQALLQQQQPFSIQHINMIRASITPNTNTLLHRFSAFTQQDAQFITNENKQQMQQHLSDLSIYYKQDELALVEQELHQDVVNMNELKRHIHRIHEKQPHPIARGVSCLLEQLIFNDVPNAKDILQRIQQQITSHPQLTKDQKQHVLALLMNPNDRTSMVDLLHYLEQQDLLLVAHGDVLLSDVQTLLSNEPEAALELVQMMQDYKQGDMIAVNQTWQSLLPQLTVSPTTDKINAHLAHLCQQLTMNESEVDKLTALLTNELSQYEGDTQDKQHLLKQQQLWLSFIKTRDLNTFNEILKGFEFVPDVQMEGGFVEENQMVPLLKMLQDNIQLMNDKLKHTATPLSAVSKSIANLVINSNHSLSRKPSQKSKQQQQQQVVPLEQVDVLEALPLPVTESELRQNPVQAIAKDLKITTSRWAKEDNLIVQQAVLISDTLSSLSILLNTTITPEARLEIVKQSKLLIHDVDFLIKYAIELGNRCPDKRLKDQVILACEYLPNCAQQLRILMNVKMSSVKNNENEDQVINSASQLSEAVGGILYACESAYVKVNSSSGGHFTIGGSVGGQKYSSFKLNKYKDGIVNREHSPIMKNVKKSKYLQEVRAMGA